jgi:hypothetical protein
MRRAGSRVGWRAGAAYAVVAVLAGALAAPVATASVSGSASPDIAATRIGHVAYVTAGNQVDVAGVNFSGNTSRPTRIGPVTKPPRNRTITITGFVGSGDGHWVAWDEVVTNPDGSPTTDSVLILRELKSDRIYRVRTADLPVGFADDQLVTYGDHTSVVVLDPSPHLEPVAGDGPPLAAYPQGTVTAEPSAAPAGPRHTVELALTTFDGSTTVLHDYVVNPGDSRVPTRAFVSSDNSQLVVELGPHNPLTGQSAPLDEYSLGDTPVRTTLGQFGPADARWRLGDLSFAGSADQVWAVWRRPTYNGIQTALAVREPSGWKRIMSYPIAVSGDSDGYVIAQVGTEVRLPKNRIRLVPGGDAMLLHGTITKVLGLAGIAFAWVVV